MIPRIRALVCGDFHIPTRAESPPPQLLEFASEDFDLLIITGDLVKWLVIERWFWSYWKEGKIVGCVGNMDHADVMKRFPEYYLFKPLKTYQVLVHHGTGIYPRGDPEQLSMLARKHGARVIITGHTHAPALLKHGDVVIVNPGSATGVLGGSLSALGKPSWAVVEFLPARVKATVYVLEDEEPREYMKQEFHV